MSEQQKADKGSMWSMRAVVRETGVSEFVLRAWERRYAALEPQRTESGHRLYSTDDVSRIRLLAALVNQGHSIGSIAKIQSEQLKKLLKIATQAPVSAEATQAASSISIQKVIETVRKFDFEAVAGMLSQARVQLNARAFLLDVVLPLMREVGDLVAIQKMDISQEHFISAIVRNHLAQIIQLRPAVPMHGRAKIKFIFATAEGELHEFGALVAACLASIKGFDSIYLGPNLPADSLVEAANELDGDFVVLGFVQDGSKYLTQVDQKLNEKIKVWAGGAGMLLGNRVHSSRVRILESLSEYDAQLDTIVREGL